MPISAISTVAAMISEIVLPLPDHRMLLTLVDIVPIGAGSAPEAA